MVRPLEKASGTNAATSRGRLPLTPVTRGNSAGNVMSIVDAFEGRQPGSSAAEGGRQSPENGTKRPQTSEREYGVGIEGVLDAEHNVVIKSIYPDSSAAKILNTGDIITHIDNISTKSFGKMSAIGRHLRGARNTNVLITTISGDGGYQSAPKTVQLKRTILIPQQ
jgi:C-terminal processing protease CtpA/Prc